MRSEARSTDGVPCPTAATGKRCCDSMAAYADVGATSVCRDLRPQGGRYSPDHNRSLWMVLAQFLADVSTVYCMVPGDRKGGWSGWSRAGARVSPKAVDDVINKFWRENFLARTIFLARKNFSFQFFARVSLLLLLSPPPPPHFLSLPLPDAGPAKGTRPPTSDHLFSPPLPLASLKI